MSELPSSWVFTQLNQLIKIQNGYAFPSKSFLKEGIPLIRQSNLNGDKVSLEKSVYLDPAWLEKKSEFIVNKGDILLGMSGSIGKWCKYNLNLIALQNQRVGKIVPLTADFVNINYVLYGLVFSERQLVSKGKGLGLLNVSASDIESLEIPLAPLNEQKRIVEKLDKLLARVEESKARLDKIPVLIKRFRQSVLNAAVTGELTKDWRERNKAVQSARELLEKIAKQREESYRIECEIAQKKKEKKPKKPENLHPVPLSNGENELPSGWIYVTFRDISSTKHYSMTSGPFGSSLGTKDYQTSGIPVIRGQNIQPAEFINSNFVYVSENKAEELKRSQTIPGDIVIVAVGAGVGNSAIIPNSIKYAVLSQNCNKFSVDSGLAFNSFILAALQISIIRAQMAESTTDTARQFLSLTNLKKMVFPLPPLEEQKEIVKRVETLFKKADEIEKRYKKAKAFVDKLTQSILAKAFRGELVPQDPNDEPAEKLLERVKAEKEKISKEKGKRKKLIEEIIKKHPKAMKKLS